jgi:hypothetical protein
MSSDQSQSLPPAPRPAWELPAIKAVAIRRAAFSPREPHNFRSPLATVPDACEIIVSLAAPLPIRAMGPMLHVGDAQLTESEAVDKDGLKIRFWGLEPGRLRQGAPIALSWMGEDKPRGAKASKFTFTLPE